MAEEKNVKPTDTLIGQQLGDYKLTQKLATGGMAKIYYGEDVKLGRRAAIKVLTPEMLEADDTLTERFEREAKAVAHLDHPNIVPIYQFGEAEGGLYFLAMKLIEGEDLADELNRLNKDKQLMPVARMLKIMEQVADALDFAHAHGIIHRDVKPSNVLLDKTGKAILTDFGLVLRQQVDKTMGTAFGTPRYISPEQALASEKSVPQSDIYSLAVIVYEILTGSMVFKADTAMQIALSHISEAPPPPRTINPHIPRAVEREILKALSKKPEDRHDSAMQFVQSLRDAYGDKITEDAEDAPADARVKTPVMRPPEIDEAIEAHLARSAQPEKDEDTVPSEPSKPVKPSRVRTETERPAQQRSPLMLVAGVVVLVGVVVAGVLASGMLETTADEQPTADQRGSSENLSVGVAPNAPPVVIGQGEPVTLYYNELAFALHNDSDTTLDLSALVIERGNGDNPFDSGDFVGDSLEPGACLVISSNSRLLDVEIEEDWGCEQDEADVMRPSNALFWRVNDDAETFDVLYNATQITTCDAITPGRSVACEFAWPQAPAEESTPEATEAQEATEES